MIEIIGLTKKYVMGKQLTFALENICLKINDGEFVAIVGPSGSGKSTFMHIVGGLDSKAEGFVLIDGKNILKYSESEKSEFRNKQIGFVFQDFNLESSQTALANVMLPLMFCGVPKKERKERAESALEKVGLKEYINHKPTELSGGQRQRVSIARALVNNPKIIFADEPTGNLDSKSGKNIMDIFLDLSEKGYTIIMVTHNLEEAKIAKRVIKIKDGKIREDTYKEV